jgi:hypothetical protein
MASPTIGYLIIVFDAVGGGVLDAPMPVFDAPPGVATTATPG